MKSIFTLFIFVSILCFGCQNDNTKPNLTALRTDIEVDSLPSRRQLRRSLFERREILIVYETNNDSLKHSYQTLLKSLSETPQQGRFSVSMTYKSIKDISEEEISNNIIFLIGTPNENPLIEKLTSNLPVEFKGNLLKFNKNEYKDNSTIFSMSFYPNPKNISLPFRVITGLNAKNIYEFVSRQFQQNGRRNGLLFQNMDYEIYKDGLKSTMGNFNDEWQIDPKVYFDYSKGNDTIFKSEHYNFISHQNAISSSNIQSLATTVENSTNELLTFLEGENEVLPKIDYHIYKTAEDKGLMLNNTDQAHFNSDDNSVHTIINDKYNDNYIQKEHNLIINSILGASKSLVFEKGLAVYFTKQWQREGYLYWGSQLAKSNNTLSLHELFDNELIQNESPLITECMSALLVDYLIKKWGKDVFLNRYKNWQPSDKELIIMQDSWQSYLKILASQTSRRPKRDPDTWYLKGFNFAHEGYGIYNGYLSRKATEALVKQKNMGVNAITIVPYGYVGRINEKPNYISIGNGARSENDQGVIHSAYEAKQLGMSVLLKPQVFVGGSWPGELDFDSEADWQGFFNYYYRWIRHYAFLAEIHNIDIFSVGVEFSIATMSHEEEWRKMFKNIRGLYNGQLTYAANWGEEFESINLWDELDFIGINSYYPLSDKNDATDAELKANFETVKSKIKKVYNKYQKPIVFTEIGFRSINAPWKLPYSDGDNNIFNEEHQDRAYKVILEGIQNEPWCAGILWWKFPSYLEYRGRENNAFTPNNKKAENTVRNWFLDSDKLN